MRGSGGCQPPAGGAGGWPPAKQPTTALQPARPRRSRVDRLTLNQTVHGPQPGNLVGWARQQASETGLCLSPRTIDLDGKIPHRPIPVAGVTIAGSAALSTYITGLYTASYHPPTATLPVTLNWDNGTIGAAASPIPLPARSFL